MRGSLFSAKTEYACEAMLELAARHGDPNPIRLKTIADAHGIPERFLVQILLQLKTAGLIASTRGASGGYQLTRDPDQITLADIVGIVEYAETSENRAPEKRDLSPAKIAIRDLWNEISDAQQAILEGTTLAQLKERTQSPEEMTYSI